MKRLLATLLLSLSLFLSAPLALAETSQDAKLQDTESFNVLEIFDISGNENAEDANDGSFSLTEDLVNEGKEVGGSPIAALLLRAINILTLLVGTFAFIMIIIGGFYFATATEESKIDKGKSILAQAVFGLIVSFLAYMIVIAVESLIL